MNYTYLLRCADGTLYCGWTNHLAARVAAHNAGKGAKYTKARRPVVLAYYEEYATRSEAMRREAAIKKLTKKEKEAMAALGRLTVNTRAHATDGFKDTCADLVEAFRNKLGNTDCSELVKVYKKDDVRCLETVCLAADVFEEFYNTYIAENKIGKIKEM